MENSEKHVFTIEHMDYMLNVLEDHVSCRKKTLLLLDIDNTFLRMKSQIGRDQWFKWQMSLIKHNVPASAGRVAKDLANLQKITNGIFQTNECEPCEEHIPDRIKKVVECASQNVSLTFLTARSHIMQDVSYNQLEHVFGPIAQVPYMLVTCSGGSKANHVYETFKTCDYDTIFFVDDTYDHLRAMASDKRFDHIEKFLFHYTHEYKDAVAFESDQSPLKKHSIREFESFIQRNPHLEAFRFK